MKFIRYDVATGEILANLHCSTTQLAAQPAIEGVAYVEGEADDRYFYIVAGEVTPRVELPYMVNGTTLSAPIGTEFYLRDWPDMTGIIDETGSVEFEFDEPGEYIVELRLFPYLDAQAVVHAY